MNTSRMVIRLFIIQGMGFMMDRILDLLRTSFIQPPEYLYNLLLRWAVLPLVFIVLVFGLAQARQGKTSQRLGHLLLIVIGILFTLSQFPPISQVWLLIPWVAVGTNTFFAQASMLWVVVGFLGLVRSNVQRNAQDLEPSEP